MLHASPLLLSSFVCRMGWIFDRRSAGEIPYDERTLSSKPIGRGTSAYFIMTPDHRQSGLVQESVS